MIPANDTLSANYEKEVTVLVRNVARNCKPHALPLFDRHSHGCEWGTSSSHGPTVVSDCSQPSLPQHRRNTWLTCQAEPSDGGLASFCETVQDLKGVHLAFPDTDESSSLSAQPTWLIVQKRTTSRNKSGKTSVWLKNGSFCTKYSSKMNCSSWAKGSFPIAHCSPWCLPKSQKIDPRMWCWLLSLLLQLTVSKAWGCDEQILQRGTVCFRWLLSLKRCLGSRNFCEGGLLSQSLR